MKSQNKTTEPIQKDAHIVLVLGAGIHNAASTKNARGNAIAQQLANWDGVQDGLHKGNLLGQTLAWELNGLDGHVDDDQQAADRLKARQRKLAKKLRFLAQRAQAFNWQPPKALQGLLQSGRVTDVISLNVDLVLEHWIQMTFNSRLLPRVQGSQNAHRRRVFKIGGDLITFWYPHGDIDSPTNLQFSLSHYAKSLDWMESARKTYKEREKIGKDEEFETWLDPILSKRQLLVLGASLDPSEWDLWFALLCRWRNFARRDAEDWYPGTWVLTRKNESKHQHLPKGYVERLECDSYPESWQALLNVVQSLAAEASENRC